MKKRAKVALALILVLLVSSLSWGVTVTANEAIDVQVDEDMYAVGLIYDAFEKDKNLEHLVDAANYLMFRYMYPYPGEYFKATDSSGSVGTVGVPINMEKGDY